MTGSGRDRRYLTYVLESIVLVEHYTRDGHDVLPAMRTAVETELARYDA